MPYPPFFRFGEQASLMWTAHRKMCDISANMAINELGKISDAYIKALEVVASLASRTEGKFAPIVDQKLSQRDAILSGYIVGLSLVEHSILSGYCAQAAALVRQELEAIAALEEIRLGKRKDGKTPHIRHVPSVPGTIYGDLSKAAHFSDTPTLRLLTAYRGEAPDAPGSAEIYLLSPQHIPNTTRQLFALHTLLLLHFAEHQAAHYSDIHAINPTEFDIRAVDESLDLLRAAGVIEY